MRKTISLQIRSVIYTSSGGEGVVMFLPGERPGRLMQCLMAGGMPTEEERHRARKQEERDSQNWYRGRESDDERREREERQGVRRRR
ncbi:hypothetical protein JW758_01085 [Candidatus Peregrinibacteria bacterium]|nr:hypothetical protein [Candidatus Peregrinibacteria bacterium]